LLVISSFELKALVPLEEGAELLICYGEAKDNLELMRDYGG
jgi:hypothetical protein